MHTGCSDTRRGMDDRRTYIITHTYIYIYILRSCIVYVGLSQAGVNNIVKLVF